MATRFGTFGNVASRTHLPKRRWAQFRPFPADEYSYSDNVKPVVSRPVRRRPVGDGHERSARCKGASSDAKRRYHPRQKFMSMPKRRIRSGCCTRTASASGGRRAAECGQQFPPSDGDCHTPLPCEVRKGNNTTSPACRLYVQGAQDAAAHSLEPIARREKPIANQPIERA